MTTLTQALSLALSGLQTSTGLMALASNNIANAQTPGYTTKTAAVTSVQYGSDLGGSTIASYSRATNTALTTSYNAATSTASYLGTQNGYMSQVQTILDSTANNPTLSNDIAQFSSAWSQYSSDPESTIQQQSVINAGRTLASDINTAASQINTLDTQVQTDTTTTVNSLNSDLSQIALLNAQIQQASGSGQQTGDLEDQRDQLVNKISAIVSVTIQNRPNGEIALYTPSGQLLVDSGTPQKFSFNDGTVTDSAGTDVTKTLTGGTLQAELQFRDSSPAGAASTVAGVGVIPKLQAQLSKLVDAFTNSSGSTPSAFATAYSNAVTASTAVGGTQHGDAVAANFFSVSNVGGVPDPGTFQVTSTLLNGTDELPQTSTEAIASSFNATATYTTSGLTATNATYATLGSAILSSFQQTANTISAQSTTATSQQTFYQQTLANTTGVNMDTELADLVNYQNSYAAAAHVITTVSQMMATLLAAVTTMTNVSSLGLQLLMTNTLQSEQSTLGTLSQQLASNQQHDNLTDYSPTDALNLLNFQNAITQRQSYVASIQTVQTRLSTYDTTMTDMEGIASQASTLASQNESFNANTASQLQAQVQNYLLQVSDDLNQQVGDRYIYSGTRYTQQPVTSDLTILGGTPQTIITDGTTLPDYDMEKITAGAPTDTNSYTADSTLIDSGFSVTYGVSSNDPSFQRLINGMRYINAAITAGQGGDTATYQSDMQQATSMLNTALTGIQTLHAGVAANQNTLTQETTAQNTNITNLQNQIGNIQQVDMTQVGTEINLLQTQLQASYSATASLEQLSLVKYL